MAEDGEQSEKHTFLITTAHEEHTHLVTVLSVRNKSKSEGLQRHVSEARCSHMGQEAGAQHLEALSNLSQIPATWQLHSFPPRSPFPLFIRAGSGTVVYILH